MKKKGSERFIDLLRLELSGRKNIKELRRIGEKAVLDSYDVMQIFQICSKTLYRWRKKGKLIGANPGKKYLFTWEAVIPLMLGKLNN